MAYTINLTNGTIFATIADGTINTSSSMILVGKNYAGYGEFLDENFIHLLENGANSVEPGAPLVGQLFYNTTLNTMQVFKGGSAGFKNLGGATSQASPGPTNNTIGDIWWDTTNQQLKVWNGTIFVLIGPASSAGQGTSGAVVDTVTDNSSIDHVVIKMFVNDVVVAIISKDPTFTPQVALSGFATIGPGMQMSTAVSNASFRGNATNSALLDNIPVTGFLRANVNATTSGTLGILNDTGLTVGADQDAKISVSTVTSAVNIQNQTQDANIAIQVNDGGSTTTALLVNGATAQVGVLGITNLNATGVGNIGAVGAAFNTVHATATTAQYADVAERFAADEEYLPGTVVELGGEAEITKATTELSENVFGVISTRAAYLMNSGAGTDTTHPPIAMTGRVPVRVTGSIRKGDRLVAAGDGLARAARANEATAFNVIGRALENKTTDDDGVIEAIVTIN
jgi:hypothetical protein